MRAVYFILWLIITALVCYLIYESSNSINHQAMAEGVSLDNSIEVIDAISGSSYNDNETTESNDTNTVKQETEQEVGETNEADITIKTSTRASGHVSVDYIEKASIEFNQNSMKLPSNPKFDEYLDSVASILITKELYVVLEGHADKKPSKRYDNVTVGKKRAEFVKQLLIQRNVPENKIEIVSKGDTEPKNNSDTDEARIINRRVELFIKQIK